MSVSNGLPNGAPRPCPRCHGVDLDPVAYPHLLGLYLGDGHITGVPNKRVTRLSIYCAAAYEGLIAEAVESMSRVNPGMPVNLTSKTGCIHVNGWWNHWPCLFPQHGPGRKHHRHIGLSVWQQDIVEAHPDRFVRGLLHSDGCRSVNVVRRRLASGVKEYSYPRWLFSNRSEDIRQLCEWAFDQLDVDHRRNLEWSISVAQRRSVEILDEVVGPKY